MKPDVRPVLGRARDHVDSWKEIAAYLGREVRTAQRWERREGLPIHRHSHAKGSSVWASMHEMEAWLDSRDREASEAAPRAMTTECAVPEQLKNEAEALQNQVLTPIYIFNINHIRVFLQTSLIMFSETTIYGRFYK
jgi:hypothetical protein